MPATKRFCLSSSGLNLTQYGTFLLVKREMHWPVAGGKRIESSELQNKQSTGLLTTERRNCANKLKLHLSCLSGQSKPSSVFKEQGFTFHRYIWSGMPTVDAASNKWRIKLSTAPCWRGTSQGPRWGKQNGCPVRAQHHVFTTLKLSLTTVCIRGLHGQEITRPNTNSLNMLIKGGGASHLVTITAKCLINLLVSSTSWGL